jgi:hypothetical protein
MKKKPQTLSEHFTTFGAAMVELERARCCECDLIGVEPALTVARLAIEREQIDRAFYAIAIVAAIVFGETGMALEAPAQHETACAAVRAMLDAFTPFLVSVEDLALQHELAGPQWDDESDGLHAV